MKFLKQFETFVNEELTAPAPAPTRPQPGTPTRPDRPERPTRPDRPTKPERPGSPEEEPTIDPIETPVVDPDPMATKFLKKLEQKGIKPKKYKK